MLEPFHSAKWFIEVLDALEELVLVKGPKSRLLWANKAFRDAYGLSTKDLSDIVDGEHADPDDTLQYVRDDRQVLATGERLRTTEPVTFVSGDVHYFDTVKTAIRDEGDNPVMTVGLSRLADSGQDIQASKDVRDDRKHTTAVLRATIAGLPLPIVVLDAQQRVVAASEGFKEISGDPTCEGKPIDEVLTSLEPLIRAIQRVADEGTPVEVKGLEVGAPSRLVHLHVQPWTLSTGVAGGTMLTLNDVTGDDLYENAPDMYVSVSHRDSVVLSCNHTLWRVVQFEKSVIIGQPVFKLYDESCLDAANKAFEQFQKTGEVHNARLLLRRKDGTSVPVLLDATAVRDDSGTIIRRRSTWRDITDLEELNRAKAEQMRLFQTTFDHAAVGIAHVSLEGQWIRVNPQVCKTLGYGEAELLSRSFQELTHPEDLLKDEALLEQTLAGEINSYTLEKRYVTKAGGLVWCRLTVALVRREDGEPDFFISVIDNVNQLKTLEQQLRDANQELEGFSYSVSHDLRAPLRAIGGYSQILEEDHADSLDGDGRRVIGVIQKNVTRMGLLIDDLLSFSRLSRREPEARNIEMKKMVNSVTDELLQTCEGRAIDISIDDLPDVHGDEAMLRQVWTNLLSNAVKYTEKRDEAKIRVSAKRTDTEIVYTVNDNGAGFEMEYADKLFGVFQRLHSDHEFHGNGVGLALVQRILKRHRGRVWGKGEANVGATFSFALPRFQRNGEE